MSPFVDKQVVAFSEVSMAKLANELLLGTCGSIASAFAWLHEPKARKINKYLLNLDLPWRTNLSKTRWIVQH